MVDCPVCQKLKKIFTSVPSIITWHLWKRRNSLRNGRTVSFNSLVLKVNTDIWRLVKILYPRLQQIPISWPGIVDYIENYRPKLYYLVVSWKPPEQEYFKCNTDGASRGNPGRSSYGFCIRNHRGDLVYAQGEEVHEATNIETEAIAIREAIYRYVSIGLAKVRVETDSLALVKILSGV